MGYEATKIYMHMRLEYKWNPVLSHFWLFQKWRSTSIMQLFPCNSDMQLATQPKHAGCYHAAYDRPLLTWSHYKGQLHCNLCQVVYHPALSCRLKLCSLFHATCYTSISCRLLSHSILHAACKRLLTCRLFPSSLLHIAGCTTSLCRLLPREQHASWHCYTHNYILHCYLICLSLTFYTVHSYIHMYTYIHVSADIHLCMPTHTHAQPTYTNICTYVTYKHMYTYIHT